ncbi:hypothetical protein F5Y10DRAFT_293071 [Nemania abortiva]|nr:hypothetical protein F5Y10DRAFT_293071 [Nemania abortiva]
MLSSTVIQAWADEVAMMASSDATLPPHTSPSKRPRSPSDTTVDLRFSLQFANIEFRTFNGHPLPEHPHITELFTDIQAAILGLQVIPAAVVAEVTSDAKKTIMNFFGQHNIDTSYHMCKSSAMEELHNLRAIITDAIDCQIKYQSEAA